MHFVMEQEQENFKSFLPRKGVSRMTSIAGMPVKGTHITLTRNTHNDLM
jgi:hypothetical protein